MTTAVRWTIQVSQDTDSVLRGFLNITDADSADVSKFVEDAVLWRMLDHTVEAIKDRNRDIPAEELEAAIDRALAEERKGINWGAK